MQEVFVHYTEIAYTNNSLTTLNPESKLTIKTGYIPNLENQEW